MALHLHITKATFPNGLSIEVPVPTLAKKKRLFQEDQKPQNLLTSQNLYNTSPYYLFLLALKHQVNSDYTILPKIHLSEISIVALVTWRDAKEDYRWAFEQRAKCKIQSLGEYIRKIISILKASHLFSISVERNSGKNFCKSKPKLFKKQLKQAINWRSKFLK
ncbi:hypothetical protein G9A89_000928 [Geosiphon pyriformis]|nr:hypothetical protein G9A89_000928 [Geosiphon pyriformis]